MADDGEVLPEWPATTGPSPVGVISFQLTDPRRVEPMAPEPRAGRRISVYAWYPAVVATGEPPRPYFTPLEARTLAVAVGRMQGNPDDAFDPLTRLVTNGRPGAAPDAVEGRRPLLVFSHGGTSHALQNTHLMEELASWGYVVLSLGHPYESGGVVLEDGSTATLPEASAAELMGIMGQPDMLRYLLGGEYPFLLDAHRAKAHGARRCWLGHWANLWAEDAVFAVDAIQAGEVPAAAAALAAATDTSRVGHFGMSYGSAAAARACQLDERAAAGASLDGALWTWDTIGKDIPTPYLALHSDPTLQVGMVAQVLGVELGPELRKLGPDTPMCDDLDFERHTELGLRPDVHRLTVPGMTHMDVTDNLIVAPLFGIPTELPIEARRRGVRLLNRLCRDFFDTYLKGLDRAFPAAVKADFPELVERDLTRLREQARAAR